MHLHTLNRIPVPRRPWARSFADDECVITQTTLLDELLSEEGALAERLRVRLADADLDCDAGFEAPARVAQRWSLGSRVVPGPLSVAAGLAEGMTRLADDLAI